MFKNRKGKPPLSIGAEISGRSHHLTTCCDWLQIDSRGMLQNAENYTLVDTHKSTLVFHKLFEIFEKEHRIASLVNTPIAKFLPHDMNLVKLLNNELYYFKPSFRLNKIIQELSLFALQPSRIDLAVDFNSFAFGFTPQNLIKSFFNDKFCKVGITKYVIDGEQVGHNITHYLKFHKPNCNVDVYLYNKSKEMREVKHKPWIVEHWKRGGLDLTKDVWRLEFSMHNPRFIVKDNISGYTDRFNWLRLDEKNYLNTVINVLINKYFDFRRNTGIKDIKSMPKVQLFTNIKDTTMIWDRSDTKESNKADLYFLKKLHQLNNEVRDLYTDIEKDTNSVINYFKETRGL
jgi:hypothetical protein